MITAKNVEKTALGTRLPSLRGPCYNPERNEPLVVKLVPNRVPTELRLQKNARPGGGIGRHKGLKIPRALSLCGFESRPGHCVFIGFLEVFLYFHRLLGNLASCYHRALMGVDGRQSHYQIHYHSGNR